MHDIWLACSGGNEHVAALLADGDAQIDAIKMGSWMGDDRLADVANDQRVLLHVSHGVVWPRSRRWIDTQVRRIRLACAPWASYHLDIGWTLLAYHWRGPSPVRRSTATKWAVRTLQRLVAQSPVPVLAENMPRWDRARPAYLVDPAFITGVVEEAGCHFLLDLAHARVSASMRREPVRDYIERLPIDRLLEVHVSGPRPSTRDGRLTDVHQPLQEEDYALLAWVLNNARPRAVTLEYTRDRAQLEQQLHHLRQMW